MLEKIKKYKIYGIIIGFILIIIKAFKIGRDKEKLKNFEKNDKLRKKAKKNYRKIISDSASAARKWLHKKKDSE